jgi:hypothetical protein
MMRRRILSIPSKSLENMSHQSPRFDENIHQLILKSDVMLILSLNMNYFVMTYEPLIESLQMEKYVVIIYFNSACRIK